MLTLWFHFTRVPLTWFGMVLKEISGQFVILLAIAGFKVSSTCCEGSYINIFDHSMSGYVQISHEGSFLSQKDFFVFWRTFGVQNEKLEDLEDKLANWRTSSELEDTCAL